jgi:transcription antitermination factor NusG
LGKPAVIKDEEIYLIQQFLQEYKNISVEKEDLQLDDEVMISDGPLLSYKGRIVEIKNKTVRLYIPSLKVALYAEVDKLSIVKAKRSN